MGIPDGQSDPASLLLTLDVVSKVLKLAADPGKLGNYVTQEMRELTGARTVIVLQSRDDSGSGEPTVVSVCPERRHHLAESKETHRLAQMCLKSDKVTFWEAGEDAGEAGAILTELGVGLSMAVPLRVGEFHVGCVLLYDLPERRHLDQVASMLETLSTAVALILRNSFLYNEQEEIIQTATQELQAANQQLRGHQQQLQASNVQLIANEQQLKAANQQLVASEQQLRASEKGLRESEAKFRSIAEQSIMGIIITQDRMFKYANEAVSDILGYSVDEMLSWGSQEGYSKIVHPDDMAFMMEQERRKQIGENGIFVRHVWKALTKAGKTRSVETYWKPILFQGGPANLMTMIDITEREKAERELRSERDFTRRLLEASPAFFVTIDTRGQTTGMNRSMLKALGYSHDEIQGADYLSTFVPERDREQLSQTFDRLISLKETTMSENHVLTKDGRELLVEWHGCPVVNREGVVEFFFGVGVDITERKRVEDALKKSEEEYRRIVEDQTEFLVRWLPNGIRTFVNDSYCRYYGISRDEAIGTSFFPLITEDYRQAVTERLESLTPENPVSTAEHQVTRPDGSIGWNQWTDRAIFDEQGKLVEYQSVGQNITGRKNREKELSEYRNQLRSLVSELTIAEDRERKKIASLLHDDVLQKLAMSKMQLGMLRETLTAGDQLETLDNIHDYVSQMFKDMRSLTFDLCPPVLYDIGLEAAVRDWFQKEMVEKHGIAVNLETQGQPLHLREDVRIALYRAIREALMNVIKHAQAQKVNVTLANLDDTVRVEIADDGIGFERSRAEQDEESSGGLGLFTVRERLEHFGGSLEIESEPGKGSRVILTAALTNREGTGKETG